MNNILEEIDVELLRLTQEGIPLIESPFKDISRISGLSEKEVVDRIKKLKNEGIIRRFGASINNRKAGINANAMVVWKVPQIRMNEVGEIFAKNDRVTHCYVRKIVPGKWEFNLYTVLHSKDHEEIEIMVNRMSKSVRIFDFKILFSSREFKKTSNGRITEQALEKLGKRR
jgi:DNA-binding Lrp family transcriptional regulator